MSTSQVPASDTEALKSNLMSILEKNRCKNFFQFAMKYDKADPSTYASKSKSEVL